MRLINLFKKTMIENFRDWKIIILTLTFAPFFVLLMYMYFVNTTNIFRIDVINRDEGVATTDGNFFYAGEELISEMKKVRSPEGAKILKVRKEKEIEIAQNRLKNKSADLVVEIPKQFSKVLLDYKQGGEPPPVVVMTYGDPANARYIMAVVWSDIITYQYTTDVTGLKGPLELQQNTISSKKSLSEFELYIPGLLAMSLIMLMFTAAASLIKEKDKGTIIRLRISNMTAFEWLSAVSLTQIIIGLLALGLTYLTAVGLGYHPSGSLFAMMVVGLLSSMAIMAISLVVAAYLRTIFDLMTIGCFPFFILMFFSGSMFPLPHLRLFTLGTRSVNINDILPITHTISALDKILNHGNGLGDVVFELGAIAILTMIIFVVGMWLFNRRHLQAG